MNEFAETLSRDCSKAIHIFSRAMLILLILPIFATCHSSVKDDPESAAIGDEMSPKYYRRKASRQPVIVLGEPIRVKEEENLLGPGFVSESKFEEEPKDEEEGEHQSPQPAFNMRQVC